MSASPLPTGAFGMTALTALTAQSTRGVDAVYAVTAEFLDSQCASVLGDIGADAVKVGMLPTPEMAAVVARRSGAASALVVDPVMVSRCRLT